MDDLKADYYKCDSIYAVAVDRNTDILKARTSLKLQRAEHYRSIAFNLYQQIV